MPNIAGGDSEKNESKGTSTEKGHLKDTIRGNQCELKRLR